VIDLHTHILPGLDDGAADLDAALEMARVMAASGVRLVCATPHVRDDFPTSPGSLERALELVQAAVAEAGIAIEVRGGAEIALVRLPRLDAGARTRFGLGGNPRLLLLETPYSTWPTDLPRMCARLREEGIVPVIAHPERNPQVQGEPTILDDVVAAGGVIQVTAASIDGRLGRVTARCARRLIELELVHLIASDAHGPGVPESGMAEAVAAVGGGELGAWLSEGVPAALLAGDELPPRPRALTGAARTTG
jgi:protein-tyrosine phosphatase